MCNCVERINERLKEFNGELDTMLQYEKKENPVRVEIKGPYTQVQCLKIDTKKRKALPALVARYCPFCGTRYERPDPDTLPANQLSAELERARNLHQAEFHYMGELILAQGRRNRGETEEPPCDATT